MTRRALFAALASVAGLSVCPGLIARWKRSQERQRWERLLGQAQAQFRAKLRAEGLDPDRMDEDEVMDYVDRVIHKYRRRSEATLLK